MVAAELCRPGLKPKVAHSKAERTDLCTVEVRRSFSLNKNKCHIEVAILAQQLIDSVNIGHKVVDDDRYGINPPVFSINAGVKI